MRKLFLGIFLFSMMITLFLLWINNKNKLTNKVITKIEEKDNMIIAINYPQTEYKDLNSKIKKYVDSYYEYFKDEFSSYYNSDTELNIDYSYYLIKNRYLCITLYVTIDTHNTDKNYKDITSILFDTKNKQEISLSKLINKNELINIIKNNLIYKYNVNIDVNNNILNTSSFSFNDNFLTLYIPSTIKDYDFYIINIDLKKYNLDEKKEIIKPTYTENNIVIDPSKKVIALTFDDGPSIYTDKILNILNKYDVTATFFVLGNKVSLYKETLKKMLQNGNEIGNHSYNHKWMIKLNSDELKKQIYDTQYIIKKELGYTPKCLRPTYGSLNNKIKNYKDFNIVLWNVDTLDWKIKNYKEVSKRALKAKDGDIILMHDIHPVTVKALDIIIPKLIENGFQFVTVSELKEIQKLREKL